MTTLQIILRVVHIVFGVFWAGTALFLTGFLGPALRDMGPEGGKVFAALVRRGLATFIPIAAVLTVLAGLWLYSRDSVGFQSAYMHSGPGMAYGLGGLSGIVALIIGAARLGPTVEKIAAHAQAPVPGDAAARDAHIAHGQALGIRAGKAGHTVAGLMIITLLAMAVARYL